MDTTTLGRGGSDTTAVALAVSLGARVCEIYTDVEGVYSADPRIVPDAVKLQKIGYEEMLELATYGAGVMAPRAVELGQVYGMPILVASSSKDTVGTLICKEGSMELRNRVSGIAHDTNVAKIMVIGVPDRPGMAKDIFEPLARANISVDTIVQNAGIDHVTDVTFTVSRTDVLEGVVHCRTRGQGNRSAEGNQRQVIVQGEYRWDGHAERSGLCGTHVPRDGG